MSSLTAKADQPVPFFDPFKQMEPVPMAVHSPAFAADFVALLASIPTLKKDGMNPHFKNKYLTIEGFVEGVKPHLFKHNFAMSQPVTAHGNAVTVTTVLTHITGEQISSALTMTVIGEPTAQNFGSMITYMRRYGGGSLLFVASSFDADDDGNAASIPAALPSEPPAPHGFDDWYAGMKITAEAGHVLLTEAWTKAGKTRQGREYQAYAQDHRHAEWETVKKLAEVVSRERNSLPAAPTTRGA